MMTEVLNLRTGEVITYALPPEEAVKAAYLQRTLKDYQTWEYEKRKVPIERGKRVVTCGDFTAILRNY